MFNRIGKFGATVAALAAVAVGASAVAGAATSNNSSSSGAAATAAQGYARQGAPPPGGANGTGPRHAPETPLTGDTAAKVKAAALAKVPGGTIERVETDSDHGSPYEAHVTKADGTQLEVLVNKDFEVTAVNTMRHP